jgi:hypothetical protein
MVTDMKNVGGFAMTEKIALVAVRADGKKFVVNLPVPQSWSSGISISAEAISGLERPDAQEPPDIRG